MSQALTLAEKPQGEATFYFQVRALGANDPWPQGSAMFSQEAGVKHHAWQISQRDIFSVGASERCRNCCKMLVVSRGKLRHTELGLPPFDSSVWGFIPDPRGSPPDGLKTHYCSGNLDGDKQRNSLVFLSISLLFP